MSKRVGFSAELDFEIFGVVQALAASEGKPVESLVEQAVIEFLHRRQGGSVSSNVMAKYRESLETFGPLYERLAR